MLEKGVNGARVRDAMSSMALSCRPGDDVLDAVALMVREGIRHVPIVDDERRVIGIVSDRDVREVLGDPLAALREDHEERLVRWPLADIMSRDPVLVSAEASLAEAAQRMRASKVGALVVVDAEHTLVGMLSYLDLLRQAYG